MAKYGNGKISFLAFCRYLNKIGLYKDPHWIPQYDYVWPHFDRLNYVGKFENLQNDLYNIINDVFDECGVDTALKEAHGPDQTKAKSKLDIYYDDECKNIIKKIYANDFYYFDYQK